METSHYRHWIATVNTVTVNGVCVCSMGTVLAANTERQAAATALRSPDVRNALDAASLSVATVFGFWEDITLPLPSELLVDGQASQCFMPSGSAAHSFHA